MGMAQSRSIGRLSVLAFLTAPAALIAGCGDDVVNHYYTNNYYGEGGAEPEPEPGTAGKTATAGKSSSSGGSSSGGSEPVSMAGDGSGGVENPGGAGGMGDGGAPDGRDSRYPDAPIANTDAANHELDLFGTWGNRYYFAVSDAQREAMNKQDYGQDGLYTPGASGKANYVDHLFITTAGKNPRTVDYGKVQAKVVGQYSRFPWDENNIPNLNIDTDQFIKDQLIAGYEHLRFNNGQRGSIFRDKLAYDLYRMLGYTAPLATYVWVESNVWGPEVSIPYTLIERYKHAFCKRNADAYGGDCVNMWEFVGDFNYGSPGGGGKMGPIPEYDQTSLFDLEENCEIGKCDATRVKELEAKLRETPLGDGFKDALAEYIDWPAFHRFQCLSWVLSTSDDTLHAGNNVVLVERADGKFQYLPYSVDISMGFGGWGGGVGLRGQNVLAQGCQADTSCWSDTLDVCQNVLDELNVIKPREYLKSLYDQLDAEGMLRPGDAANMQGVDSYFKDRLVSLPKELEGYRNGSYCEYPYVECNGSCVYQGECYCVPPKPLPGGEGGAPAVDPGPVAGAPPAVGGDGGGPIECPAIVNYAVAR